MSDSEYIGFKEMCARFDVTPRTLRYYEYIELLRPQKDGRARFYGPREVARMNPAHARCLGLAEGDTILLRNDRRGALATLALSGSGSSSYRPAHGMRLAALSRPAKSVK